MRALSSCSAIIAAALLLTSTPALATDAEAGGAGRPASPARPSMVGLPAKDSASSLPLGWMEFVTVGDEAYFVAEGQRPGELWRSDGTTEGTVLVTDRLATEREDPITHMTAVGDELYFSGEHRETGAELWRTDGTAEGTALVVDLMPGEANSYPRNIVALDDLVLFWAKGAGRSCGLWRTDGTPAGTTLVRGVDGFEVRSPDSHHCPYPETALRIGDAAILWFNTGGRHEVWRSDGSDEGTTLLRAFPHRSDWREWVLRADGGAYFTADDGEHGRELWRIDGTADGTTLFADVAPGPTGADPEPVGVVAGMVFFIADGPKRSRALWVSDGTEDGTTMLRKLKSGWQYDWEPGDSLFYFWADDGRHGSELWRSDGTRKGTWMVRDIAKGRKSSGPQGYSEIATVGDTAFFAARDGKHGTELWASDGTREGTRLVLDIGPGQGGTGPNMITRLGGVVLFGADDREHGQELWRSDGSPEGTHIVRDISARMASLTIYDATGVGEDLVYIGSRAGRGAPLYWIDGATGQEHRLATVITGEISHEVEALGDDVIFTGYKTRTGAEPWISRGTVKGTRLLKDIARGRTPNICTSAEGCGTHAADSSPDSFVTMGDVTYFAAYDPEHGRELWRTDGTRAGTRLVKDVRPGRESGLAGGVADGLVAVGGHLYFVADDGRHGSELWRSDGTRAGTKLIADIGPGWSVQWWDTPVAAGDYVYFGATSESEGLELWRTDGTAAGTALVRDIRPGPKASKPQDLTAVGDMLLFTAIDRQHGRELWRTDGTTEGTVLVMDLAPGKASSLLGEFSAIGGDLFFTVWDGPGELVIPGTMYRSDGTAEGTQPFGPAQDGAGGIRRFWTEYPSSVVADDRLFFAADDGIRGVELWSTDGTPEGTRLVDDLRPGSKGSAPEWFVAADSYLYFTADDGKNGRQFWQLPLTDT